MAAASAFPRKVGRRTALSGQRPIPRGGNWAPVGYLQLNRGRVQTEHPLENAAEIQRIYVLSGVKGRGIGSLN